MLNNQDRLKRLAYVAHRYYIDDCKQSDIAKEMGVSRPLISRLLTEAKALGVVEITVHQPDEESHLLLNELCSAFFLRGGALSADGIDDKSTNYTLCQSAYTLLNEIPSRRLGIGWGHFIGQFVSYLEENPPATSKVEHLLPLVGNAGISIRNYHSNENVRLMAQRLEAVPHFLYLPALAESYEEKQLLCSTELFQQIQRQWRKMDTTLVNIGNYPSSPDFASRARYGDLLQKKKACGRLLSYFFNAEGEIIRSANDFAIQIPLEELSACPNVVGVCSANTSTQALLGALRTGMFTHIVAREELAREVLDQL